VDLIVAIPVYQTHSSSLLSWYELVELLASIMNLEALFSPSWLSLGITAVLTLAAAAATNLYLRLRRREFIKPFESLPIPQGPGFHLIFGHVPFLNPDFQQGQRWVALDSADKQGRTGYWHAFYPAISVTHWQDARQVLMAEEYRETLKVAGKHLKMLLGYNNLLVLDGKIWKHHRSAVSFVVRLCGVCSSLHYYYLPCSCPAHIAQLLSPFAKIAKTFTPASLASYKECMVKVVDTMCTSVLRKLDTMDTGYYETTVEKLMKMITMDVFGLAAFSTDFGSSKTITPSPFASAFESLASGMTTRFDTNPLRPSNYFYSYPSELNRNYKKAQTLLRQFLMEQVQERQAADGRFASGEKKDLLAYMVDAHESMKEKEEAVAGSVNVDEVLSDIMMTILFAGYDTTSITLSYALYLVSQSSKVYERALQEIDACSDLVDTDKLQYCHAIIREALRLYSPAPATLRMTRKDITLHDGFVIPKGTTVYIPIFMMQRLEHNFERGQEFLPERWVARDESGMWVERDASSSKNDEGISAANVHAFFSFSGGARNCPGSRFALQEATIVLAGLLTHLRFDALPNYKLSPGKVAVAQHPDDFLPMRISRRVK
jgi:cytochrome P450